jgi:hypothetical protein
MDHLQDAVVLFEVDVELYVCGLVSAGLSYFLVALEGLQDLERALDDALDGSVFIDLLGEVFVLDDFLLGLAGLL